MHGTDVFAEWEPTAPTDGSVGVADCMKRRGHMDRVLHTVDIKSLQLSACSPGHAMGAYRPSDIVFRLSLDVSPVTQIRLHAASGVRATI